MPEHTPNSVFDGRNSPVFLITTAKDGKQSGMIATWVMSASLVPEHKRLVLVLSPHNHTTQLLLERGLFAVHVMHRNQLDLVPVFGLHSSASKDKFANCEYEISSTGLPLITSACGWAEVQLHSHIHDQDRVIVVGHVTTEQVTSSVEALTTEHLKLLPDDVQKALTEQFSQDSERDRQMIIDS